MAAGTKNSDSAEDVSPSRDKLFEVEAIPEDFAFNERVAEVFDDMLDRSIPFYQEAVRAAARLLAQHLQPGDQVCDLGCATGAALLQFARLLKDLRLTFHGIDNSAAMLNKARLKAELYAAASSISFSQEDIIDVARPQTGAFLLNYTMQFIRPLQRPMLARKIYDNLRPGGILIMSEKTILSDKRLNRTFIEIYHDFKRERGYSELEIARKREALENILIPFSYEENCALLEAAGFKPVTPFFLWFNFCSIAAIKPA